LCSEYVVTGMKTVQGTYPTIPPSYIRVSAVVWECGKGQTDTHTQTAVTNIHFASATPQVKCNNTNVNITQVSSIVSTLYKKLKIKK